MLPGWPKLRVTSNPPPLLVNPWSLLLIELTDGLLIASGAAALRDGTALGTALPAAAVGRAGWCGHSTTAAASTAGTEAAAAADDTCLALLACGGTAGAVDACI